MKIWKNISIRGLLVLVTLSSVLCSCGTNDKDQVSNLFFSYDFTLEKKTIKERVVFLDSLGYGGLTFPVNKVSDLIKIDEYRQYIASETDNRLKIPAVFYHHNMANLNAPKVWKPLVDRLAGSETDILVIISKVRKIPFDQGQVVHFFQEISDYAKDKHLNIVIYPHDKTYIESAEETLPYIQAAARDNLFLSFHLCHELRAGNGARIDAAIAKVAPFIKMASISGSNVQMQADSLKGWADAIRPLYKGDYDLIPYLESLVRHGYRGPVALHTFGLKEPIGEHFVKSKAVWDKMCVDVGSRTKEK